ncbi:MAG: inositol-3-phosphate synthase [Acidobacteriota bacterium]|nr:inositol-3-phosphate synthase [Acidobacteriota bacterium]
MKAVFDQEYVKRINGPNVKVQGSKMDKAGMLMEDIRNFKSSTGASRLVMIWCGSTEVFHRPGVFINTTIRAAFRRSPPPEVSARFLFPFEVVGLTQRHQTGVAQQHPRSLWQNNGSHY